MDFEEIYTIYFDDVYRYVRKLSGSQQMAEEITSDTFFKAMGSIQSFRGECDLRVWLCQIAKHCYYSHLKKNGRLMQWDEGALGHVADQTDPIDEHMIRQEEANRLRQLLHTLQEPYKEVFMWRAFGELEFKQIGQLFGKSGNWACVTYHRARAMLKSRLEEGSHET